MQSDSGAVVYFHCNCADGRVAASLLVAHLLRTGAPNLQVHSASASMSNFKYPPADTSVIYFVDLCPRIDMVARLEACARRLVVLDHHLSARATAAYVAARPKWTVHLHMDLCGAQVVDRVFPRVPGGRLAGLDDALAYVADYDLWRRPDEDVFRFHAGLGALWHECTIRGVPTDVGNCVHFIASLAETPCAEIAARGAPLHAAVVADYKRRAPFVVHLAPPTPAWDGVAVGVELASGCNPTLLCHWLLRDFPGAEVAVGLWPPGGRDDPAPRRVSMRSRTICLPKSAETPAGHLEWAFGHAHACGGALPPSALETIQPIPAEECAAARIPR